MVSAVTATFRRRRSLPPTESPLALTGEFGTDPTKVKQWDAFVRRGRPKAGPTTLSDVTALLAAFLTPPSRSAAAGHEFTAAWPPGGPWA